MPLDTSIPLQVTPPSFDTVLKPVSSLLGIQGQQLANQANSQNIETSRLQQQQIAAQTAERERLGAIDWNAFHQPDGSFDAVGASNAALKASPAYYGPAIAKQLNETAKDLISIKNSTQDLNAKQRTDIASTVGALAMDPALSPERFTASLAQLADTNPALAPLITKVAKYAPVHDVDALRSWALNTRNSMLAPTSQGVNTLPVSNGAQTTLLQNSPYMPGAPQQVGAIANQIPPGERQTIQTDQLHNPYVVIRDANGNITGTSGVPGAYTPGSPPPAPVAPGAKPAPRTGPIVLAPGQPQQIAAQSDELTAAHAAANNAPVMHDINRTIIAEIDKGTKSGMWGQAAKKLSDLTGGAVAGDAATDNNVLGKMLERQALVAAQSMGPHTNAGLEAAVRANGSLEYTPAALKKIATLNDALTTGAEFYRAGVTAAIDAAGGDVTAKRTFDKVWADNFDVRLMRLHNAMDQGDNAEVQAIIKEAGGPGSKGANTLMMKNKAIQTLTKQGRL